MGRELRPCDAATTLSPTGRGRFASRIELPGGVREEGRSTPPRSKILAVADLLDDGADPPVDVDLVQQILRGHEAVVTSPAGRLDLLLKGTPEDLGNLGPAHAAHRRKHGVVVQIRDE